MKLGPFSNRLNTNHPQDQLFSYFQSKENRQLGKCSNNRIQLQMVIIAKIEVVSREFRGEEVIILLVRK